MTGKLSARLMIIKSTRKLGCCRLALRNEAQRVLFESLQSPIFPRWCSLLLIPAYTLEDAAQEKFDGMVEDSIGDTVRETEIPASIEAILGDGTCEL